MDLVVKDKTFSVMNWGELSQMKRLWFRVNGCVVVNVEVQMPCSVLFQKAHHGILNRTLGMRVRQHLSQACLWSIASRHDARSTLAHPVKHQQMRQL